MRIEELEPKELWGHFKSLNAVPRPSKKEAQIIEFMIRFAQQNGLEVLQDSVQNVIIKKPATLGMEDRKTIVLQAHLDMVHQKNADKAFNFESQGIEMIVDGDWVMANGTTLGADNGIGVAAIMALLSSTNIQHPAIEALFTIDEETGMTGAKHLDAKNISGSILLNLDTEDDDELSIGCAGGLDTNTSYAYLPVKIKEDYEILKISISGLLGGHSGMDIDKGRGNANKLLVRILYEAMLLTEIQLIEFDGGSLRNAIPREANCTIAVHRDELQATESRIQSAFQSILEEFATIEPSLKISVEKTTSNNDALSQGDMQKIIHALYAVNNGVYRMSPDIDGLVEASTSLARVLIRDGEFITQSLQRSSVESSKKDVANAVRSAFENMGCSVIQTGDYPGWVPNPNATIVKLMREIYLRMFKVEPKIKACHAGLECGILGKHLPGVEMISFGPNIRAAHSPDEKVQISSVQKFWGFFLETLQSIPANN
jgi:dipeptidase D